MFVELTAITHDAEAHLDDIAATMTDLRGAFTEVIPILESGEQRLFRSYHGRYVRTGDTMRSLTQATADHAIRQVTADELVFGTSVWYAKFLKRKKKSAVLVLRPTERKQVSRTVLDRMMERRSKSS